MSQVERSLVLVKPDGYSRGLTGEVLRRIEAKGYKLVALKIVNATEEILSRHYAEHVSKPFYPGLVEFMTSAPVVAVVVEGQRVVEGVRSLMGATDPHRGRPGHDPWRPGPRLGHAGHFEYCARFRFACLS